MLPNAMLSARPATVNPAGYLRVRADDLRRLIDASDAVAAALATASRDRYLDAVGVLRANVAILARHATEADPIESLGIYEPCGIYEPADLDEPEPYLPSPDESAWAAEHVAPFQPPRDAAGMARLVGDVLESLGYEPDVQGDAVGCTAGGVDYRIDVTDMDEFWRHMEEQRAAEYPDEIERAEMRMPAPRAIPFD